MTQTVFKLQENSKVQWLGEGVVGQVKNVNEVGFKVYWPDEAFAVDYYWEDTKNLTVFN
ncbi:hypothetical protein ACI2JA_03220 [Alkalihalobacillus sp. NPDC078783]